VVSTSTGSVSLGATLFMIIGDLFFVVSFLDMKKRCRFITPFGTLMVQILGTIKTT
jgi:hypothetical protein